MDALRDCINGSVAAALPLWQGIAVLFGAPLAMTALSVCHFRRSK